jgi:hypothetical protein
MKRSYWSIGLLAVLALWSAATPALAKKTSAWIVTYRIDLGGTQPTVSFSQPSDTLRYHGWVFFVNTNADGDKYEDVMVKVKAAAGEDTTVFGSSVQLGNKPGDFKAVKNQKPGGSESVMLDFCWKKGGPIPPTSKAQDGPTVVVDGSDSGKNVHHSARGKSTSKPNH